MLNDFHGLPTRTIGNDDLRVEFLTEVGPRIVRLFLRGSDENWLAEVPQEKITTEAGDYYLRGGHRLWYAPETILTTYQPDHEGVIVEEVKDGVWLHQTPGRFGGVLKSIGIHLHAKRAGLTLTHRVENLGRHDTQLAPWAITMLPLGGVAILPQTTHAIDEDGLSPNRNFVLWAYTRVNDSRLDWRDDFIRVHARAQLPPCKIGYFSRSGKVGYWRHGVLFVKKFPVHVDSPYPDFHCNVEVYCNDKFIELETLGPIRTLYEGARLIHTESWEWHTGIDEFEQVTELIK